MVDRAGMRRMGMPAASPAPLKKAIGETTWMV